jgi:hypothetical protein
MPREDISPFGPQHDRAPEVVDDVPRPEVGFGGRRGKLWTGIARWLVPLMMCIAYVFMALTAETDASNQAWMAIGLAFVLVLWWLFRILSSTAALSRAVAVGDVGRILMVADRELAGRRRGRARFLAAKAYAYEVRGAWPDALAAVDEATAAIEREHARSYAPYIAAVRVAALVETGVPARVALRPLVGVRGFELDGISRVAHGRVAWADGKLDEASRLFQRVIDDIRAGSAQRATAHAYAARIADKRGHAGEAARHRAEAKKLLPYGWVGRV